MGNEDIRNIIIKSNLLIIVLITITTGCSNKMYYNKYVDRFTGTGGNIGLVPVASMPFGMVQLRQDTRSSNTGYHYNDQTLIGFSHIHKSGAGCSDFQDILFLPLPANSSANNISELKRKQFSAALIHEVELAEPG
jgi:putative alpha-1,2-mannosidase